MFTNSKTTLAGAVLGVAIGFGLSTSALAQATFTPAQGAAPTNKTTPATKPDAKPAAKPAAKDTKDAATAKDAAKPAATKDAPAPIETASADDGAEPAWTKICGVEQTTKKNICFTKAEVKTPDGQPVAGISIQKIPDQDKYRVQTVLPIGVVLPPGVVLVVDGSNKPLAKLVYVICAPQPAICSAEAVGDNAFIDGLKKGKKLQMVAVNPQGKEFRLDVALASFGKVFDGEGIDIATAQAKQEELNKALQARAEERRQRLIDQQNKASATPASATGTPAPAAKQ